MAHDVQHSQPLSAFAIRTAWENVKRNAICGWSLRWVIYLWVTVTAEGMAAVWSVAIEGNEQARSFVTFLAHAAVGAGGYGVSAVALAPFVATITGDRYIRRLLEASGAVCATLALQSLALSLLATQMYPGERFSGRSFAWLVGDTRNRSHTGLAWLDFVLPDPPLLLAAVLMLMAAGFRPAQLRVATLLCGMAGWIAVELIVRPLLVR